MKRIMRIPSQNEHNPLVLCCKKKKKKVFLSFGQGEITFPPHNKFISLPDLIIPTLS